MDIARISSKGQIVIPKSLRDSHRIRTGDRFIVSSVGDELRLRPVSGIDQVSLDSVAGMLHDASRRKLGDADVEARIGARLLEDDNATKSTDGPAGPSE
jgi:AbrB family looped-hinge helix DNA binding protein